jgi:hypothetical protein
MAAISPLSGLFFTVKKDALDSTETPTPACHSSPKPAQRHKKGIKSQELLCGML